MFLSFGAIADNVKIGIGLPRRCPLLRLLDAALRSNDGFESAFRFCVSSSRNIGNGLKVQGAVWALIA